MKKRKKRDKMDKQSNREAKRLLKREVNINHLALKLYELL